MEKFSKHKIGELFVVVLLFSLVGLVFQQTTTSLEEQGVASGGPLDNAAQFPEFIALVILGLAVLQMVRVLRGSDLQGAPSNLEIAVTPTVCRDHVESGKLAKNTKLKALSCLAIYLVYILVIEYFGYHIATPVMLVAMFWILGDRNVIRILAIAFGTSLLIAFVFEFLLKVVLPLGIFNLTLPI